MPRKLTKNDNIVFDYLVKRKVCADISNISVNIKLSEIKVISSLERLLQHGIIRRINGAYQAL